MNDKYSQELRDKNGNIHLVETPISIIYTAIRNNIGKYNSIVESDMKIETLEEIQNVSEEILEKLYVYSLKVLGILRHNFPKGNVMPGIAFYNGEWCWNFGSLDNCIKLTEN